MRTYRQTIRTFYEVKDGVVRILHTDPVRHPKAGRNKEASYDRVYVHSDHRVPRRESGEA